MGDSQPEFLTGPGLARDAYEFAAAAHEGQTRKGDDSPYIAHPVELARLLVSAGQDDEVVLAAAFLHDTVEDTDTTLDDIRERFGDDVHAIVDAMTEDKDVTPYEARKNHHRDEVEAGDDRATLVYCADKLANLRDMRALYAAEGEGASAKFNAPIDVRARLWRADAEMIERGAPDFPLLASLRSELDAFDAERASTA